MIDLEGTNRSGALHLIRGSDITVFNVTVLTPLRYCVPLFYLLNPSPNLVPSHQYLRVGSRYSEL